MNRRIRDTAARSVITILALPDDPLLPDGSVDRVFFCNVWHHIDDKKTYLSTVRKILKPGGQVVMIDFHKRDILVGPPAEMRIAREDVVRQLETSGFRLAKEHTFLPYQYFLVFTAQ